MLPLAVGVQCIVLIHIVLLPFYAVCWLCCFCQAFLLSYVSAVCNHLLVLATVADLYGIFDYKYCFQRGEFTNAHCQGELSTCVTDGTAVQLRLSWFVLLSP